MSKRWAATAAVVGLAVSGAACGHPEKSVVENYFRAVNAEDTQTLSSFATVNFDKKVESWTITAVSEEDRRPAPLPELVKKVDEVQAQLDANKKEYNAYFLDHPAEVDQVRELLKNDGNIPRNLQQIAEDWQKFVDREKELKRAIAEAKDAVSHEKKNVRLSVGDVDNIETLSGDVVEKQIDLNMTTDGQSAPYRMTLRRYDLKPAEGSTGRTLSRWVIFGLEPA